MSLYEIEKAGRFRFYEDRMRYMAGKITVKLLLMQYLAEKKVIFLIHRLGKPYHKEISGKQTVKFDFSHSGSVDPAVFALDMNVGADVQKIAECPDYMEIARNFYTVEETVDIEKYGGQEVFFRYWAAKEAYIKAREIGLNRGMDFFSVRDGGVKEDGKEKQGWRLVPVEIGGYSAFVPICEKRRN